MDKETLLKKLQRTSSELEEVNSRLDNSEKCEQVLGVNKQLIESARNSLLTQLRLLEEREEIYGSFIEYLERALVLENSDRIILRVPDNGIGHMLREDDIPTVSKILNFLNSYDVTPYVTGGVLRDYFETGRKAYGKDIDILGVLSKNQKKNKDLLQRLNDRTNTLKTSEKGFVNRIKIGEDFYLVKSLSEGIEVMYLSMSHPAVVSANDRGIAGKFKIMPDEMGYFLRNMAAIDLTLMSKEEFDGQYRR